MSEQQTPEGMITVQDFARRKGLTRDKVVEMIKDGFYVGRVIGKQWYVDPTELFGAGAKTKSQKGTVYQSEYETARKVSMFISFLGWVVFAGGVITAFVGMASGLQSRYDGGASVLAVLPGLGITVSGLFLVAAGQVMRATVDNADHTREILTLIREKT